MLIFSAVRRGYRWTRAKIAQRRHATQLEPALMAAPASGEWLSDAAGDQQESAPLWHHGHHGHPGHHHHQDLDRDDAFMNYGKATAFGVGMIIGAVGLVRGWSNSRPAAVVRSRGVSRVVC